MKNSLINTPTPSKSGEGADIFNKTCKEDGQIQKELARAIQKLHKIAERWGCAGIYVCGKNADIRGNEIPSFNEWRINIPGRDLLMSSWDNAIEFNVEVLETTQAPAADIPAMKEIVVSKYMWTAATYLAGFAEQEGRHNVLVCNTPEVSLTPDLILRVYEEPKNYNKTAFEPAPTAPDPEVTA